MHFFGLKKGVGGLGDNAISFVVTAIVIGIGATIMASILDSQGSSACAGFWNATSDVCQVSATNTTVLSGPTAAVNSSAAGLGALNTFSDNLGTLALVVVFGVILFFLGRFLVTRQAQ